MDRFDKIPFEDLSQESTWIKIGNGSFGSVFRGSYLGLEVAIKEVSRSNEYDVDKYFDRETKIMQESRHPNIVLYLGLCLAPSSSTTPHLARILIVSEYLPRGNLRNYIHNQALPFGWRLRLSFCIDIARAVAYLHARNCMHRDLKGENLLITENERIKLCDFGFARLAAKDEMEMRRMSYCGTDGFMAPEIMLGDGFGLPADIFSLGVIFCEISSRQIVHGEVFKREMPRYEMSTLEIRERASRLAPSAFVNLTLSCLDTTASNRPLIRDILAALQTIEAELIQEESGNKNTVDYSVGSISFAGSRGRITGQKPARKDRLRRVPSFDGLVKVGHRRGEDKNEEDDEDIELTMLELEDFTIDVDVDGEHSVQLDDIPDRLVTRSTNIRRSSMATLKGFDCSASTSVHRLDNQPSLGSIPSIPSAWINAGLSTNDYNSAISSTVVVEGDHAILVPSVTKEGKEQNEDRLELGEGNDIFHSAGLRPTPSHLSTFSASALKSLHRFSIIKPAWFMLTLKTLEYAMGYNINEAGINRTTASKLGKRNSCQLCEKGFARLRAFLQCDDCGYRCHLKCSDSANPFCDSDDSELFIPLAPTVAAIKSKPSIADLAYNGSRLAAKLLKRSK